MNTKKIIAIILCLATVVAITAACTKKEPGVDDVTVYQTDAFGEIVTDENGEKVTLSLEDISVEYVTDKNGNKVLDEDGNEATILHYYITDVDDEGNVVTDENKKPVTKEHTSSNKENTTAGLGNLQDYINGDEELPTVEIETIPEGTTIKENKKLLEKAFGSGKFYMDLSVENQLGMPMTMTLAISGSDKIYVGFNVNMLGLKMGYATLQANGKSYAIDTNTKTYCESDSVSSDISDVDEITSSLVYGDSMKYVQTSEVKYKGVKYFCEEYETEMGTSKYYFDKTTEELKRIEHNNSDAKTVLVVKKFVKNPSDSYFTVPGGYRKVSPEEFNGSFENVLGSLGVPQ